MSEEYYYQKYLKYKNKYLLEKLQIGGATLDLHSIALAWELLGCGRAFIIKPERYLPGDFQGSNVNEIYLTCEPLSSSASSSSTITYGRNQDALDALRKESLKTNLYNLLNGYSKSDEFIKEGCHIHVFFENYNITDGRGEPKYTQITFDIKIKKQGVEISSDIANQGIERHVVKFGLSMCLEYAHGVSGYTTSNGCKVNETHSNYPAGHPLFASQKQIDVINQNPIDVIRKVIRYMKTKNSDKFSDTPSSPVKLFDIFYNSVFTKFKPTLDINGDITITGDKINDNLTNIENIRDNDDVQHSKELASVISTEILNTKELGKLPTPKPSLLTTFNQFNHEIFAKIKKDDIRYVLFNPIDYQQNIDLKKNDFTKKYLNDEYFSDIYYNNPLLKPYIEVLLLLLQRYNILISNHPTQKVPPKSSVISPVKREKSQASSSSPLRVKGRSSIKKITDPTTIENIKHIENLIMKTVNKLIFASDPPNYNVYKSRIINIIKIFKQLIDIDKTLSGRKLKTLNEIIRNDKMDYEIEIPEIFNGIKCHVELLSIIPNISIPRRIDNFENIINNISLDTYVKLLFYIIRTFNDREDTILYKCANILHENIQDSFEKELIRKCEYNDGNIDSIYYRFRAQLDKNIYTMYYTLLDGIITKIQEILNDAKTKLEGNAGNNTAKITKIAEMIAKIDDTIKKLTLPNIKININNQEVHLAAGKIIDIIKFINEFYGSTKNHIDKALPETDLTQTNIENMSIYTSIKRNFNDYFTAYSALLSSQPKS